MKTLLQSPSTPYSYRCYTRPQHQAALPGADCVLQIKAPNAEEAGRLARLVAPADHIVVDVERVAA